MTSRASSRNGSTASWAQFWPLLFAVPVVLFVGLYYLGPVEYHADDAKWLLAADSGFAGLWQPHPFNHFRPSFYVWIAMLAGLTSASPLALGFAGILLQVVSICLVYTLARQWLSVRDASFAAAVFAIHPVRQTHWFWTSGHIDALCVAFAVTALILASRSMKKGPSGPALAGIALATLAAALSKETGFALPLAVMLLPDACSRRTRVAIAGSAGIGALIALIWSASVLDGGGRAASLLGAAELRTSLRYCLRLVMPFDWFRFSNLYTAPSETRGLWFALALLLSFGTTAVVLLMVWFRRREPWARIGFVLIVWGGAALLFHQGPGGDRSMVLGAVGFVLLVGGYAQSLSNRSAFVVLTLLALFWTPRWLAYADEWRAVDEYDGALTSAMHQLRSDLGPQPELVVLGLPFTIGEAGEVIDVDDVDDRASRAFLIYFANSDASAPNIEFTYPMLRLSIEPPGLFGDCNAPVLLRGQALSEEVIVERVCGAPGYLNGVVIDADQLLAVSGDALPVVWTGTKLLPIRSATSP